MWCFIAFVLVSVACVQCQQDKKEVCYQHVGCFNNSPPYNNTEVLPNSPAEIDTKLQLYTRDHPGKAFLLDYTNVSSIRQSSFYAKLPVKVIIHGFYSRAKGNWVDRMKNEILIKEDANVISLDWSKGSRKIDYLEAVANIRVVAVEMTLLLEMMVKDLKVPMENIHIVGHSLGAHLAGLVGHLMASRLGSKIGRITALDPAEYAFSGFPEESRIDSSDAAFVDAIHSDAAPFTTFGVTGGLGLIESVGHVDFYPNGGKKQPGCKTPWEKFWDFFGGKRRRSIVSSVFTCSHARSRQLYEASINNPCVFSSFPCDSYEKFQRGECTTCGEDGCAVMGYPAQSAGGRGKQYVKTLAKESFCGYQYKVTARLEDAAVVKKVEGTLHISFGLENGLLSSEGTIKSSDAKIDDSSYQGVIIVDKLVDDVEAVIAQYKPKDSDESTKAFLINSLEITALRTNNKQLSVPGPYFAGGESSATISMEQSEGVVIG